MGVTVTVGVKVPISIDIYVEDGDCVDNVIESEVCRSLGSNAELDGVCDVYSVDCSEIPDLEVNTIVGEQDEEEDDDEEEEEEVTPKKKSKKR